MGGAPPSGPLGQDCRRSRGVPPGTVRRPPDAPPLAAVQIHRVRDLSMALGFPSAG